METERIWPYAAVKMRCSPCLASVPPLWRPEPGAMSSSGCVRSTSPAAPTPRAASNTWCPTRSPSTSSSPTGTRLYGAFALAGTEVLAELQAHDVERPGETIEVQFDMQRAILIDPESERVL